jgi:hypothetical protein
MRASQDGQDLSRVEKRAIEASAVAPVIESIARRIGWDDALALLKRTTTIMEGGTQCDLRYYLELNDSCG